MYALQLQQKKHWKYTSFCSLLSLTRCLRNFRAVGGWSGEKRAEVNVHVAFTAQKKLVNSLKKKKKSVFMKLGELSDFTRGE